VVSTALATADLHLGMLGFLESLCEKMSEKYSRPEPWDPCILENESNRSFPRGFLFLLTTHFVEDLRHVANILHHIEVVVCLLSH
jgi:hypothetical protein